jgi:hypothetical protein
MVDRFRYALLGGYAGYAELVKKQKQSDSLYNAVMTGMCHDENVDDQDVTELNGVFQSLKMKGVSSKTTRKAICDDVRGTDPPELTGKKGVGWNPFGEQFDAITHDILCDCIYDSELPAWLLVLLISERKRSAMLADTLLKMDKYSVFTFVRKTLPDYKAKLEQCTETAQAQRILLDDYSPQNWWTQIKSGLTFGHSTWSQDDVRKLSDDLSLLVKKVQPQLKRVEWLNDRLENEVKGDNALKEKFYEQEEGEDIENGIKRLKSGKGHYPKASIHAKYSVNQGRLDLMIDLRNAGENQERKEYISLDKRLNGNLAVIGGSIALRAITSESKALDEFRSLVTRFGSSKVLDLEADPHTMTPKVCKFVENQPRYDDVESKLIIYTRMYTAAVILRKEQADKDKADKAEKEAKDTKAKEDKAKKKRKKGKR